MRYLSRRSFFYSGLGSALGAASLTGCGSGEEAGITQAAKDAAPKVEIIGVDLLPVRATERTVWLFVRLRTDAGLTGLGEASDAFGFQNTTKAQADEMLNELKQFALMIEGQSPMDIDLYRDLGRTIAKSGGLVPATAFSAIEQAMWDLTGQMMELPIHGMIGMDPKLSMFTGEVRGRLPVYANINRATQPRTPEGFAATARRAYEDGFRAMKAAPFDGFPPVGSPDAELQAAADMGIAALVAMRQAVGPEVKLMVDAHSNFDVPLAIEVARRLEPVNLNWYEEPVPPELIEETIEIHKAVKQRMAGGELLFGVEGFSPLWAQGAVDVIMPDVKHCGGIKELAMIAASAIPSGVTVAPHNPSGPVSTAHSVQVAAAMPNFEMLELQWGEVDWRSEVLDPPEVFENGTIAVPSRPGLGVKLNENVIRGRLM